ncbi:hypothetical protein BDF20DRAFT_833426 [Mycotypha africana]|uniref:uncharacterized protein n=1 Tax=Mycotypha africana TaxID=64632 RepID=UPI002300012A|nr:uncharacterized protein BDF20DRAFT_833426 [Mycotypha africana]KAI8988592.1 hypothetical protein BDF20DRAFT_833426 [Mycotypha africana]
MTSTEFSYYSYTPNPIRFSLASYRSEDTIDSAGLATPVDASPLPPPSNVFSVINIVNDDPLPDRRGYPAVAASYAATARQQAQTTVAMASPTTPTVTIPPSYANSTSISAAQAEREGYITYFDTIAEINGNNLSCSPENTNTSSRKRKLWPKLKQLMPTNAVAPAESTTNNISTTKDRKLKHLFKSMTIKAATNKHDSTVPIASSNLIDESRYWPPQKRSQLGTLR